MNTTVFEIPDTLRPYIAFMTHDIVDHERMGSLIIRPIPNGSIVLYLQFSHPLIVLNPEHKSLPTLKAFVVGVFKLGLLHYVRLTGREEAVVVVFKSGGFSSLFGVPASLIQNRLINFVELLTPESKAHLNLVLEAMTVQQRGLAIQKLLTKLAIKAVGKCNNNIEDALNSIHSKNGIISVNKLCQTCFLSLRSIERYFYSNVGISPKEYIRIARFNAVIQYLVRSRFDNWHEIIFRFGYYDQAHFIHEFKLVTGFTPTDFIGKYKSHFIFKDRGYLLIFNTLLGEKMNKGSQNT